MPPLDASLTSSGHELTLSDEPSATDAPPRVQDLPPPRRRVPLGTERRGVSTTHCRPRRHSTVHVVEEEGRDSGEQLGSHHHHHHHHHLVAQGGEPTVQQRRRRLSGAAGLGEEEKIGQHSWLREPQEEVEDQHHQNFLRLLQQEESPARKRFKTTPPEESLPHQQRGPWRHLPHSPPQGAAIPSPPPRRRQLPSFLGVDTAPSVPPSSIHTSWASRPSATGSTTTATPLRSPTHVLPSAPQQRSPHPVDRTGLQSFVDALRPTLPRR